MPSPIRASAGTGDDNQPSQPNTKDKTSKVKKKFEANTALSANNPLRDAENSTPTESQRQHLSLTTKKQRSSEMAKQPANNLYPYSLRSQNKTLEINQKRIRMSSPRGGMM